MVWIFWNWQWKWTWKNVILFAGNFTNHIISWSMNFKIASLNDIRTLQYVMASTVLNTYEMILQLLFFSNEAKIFVKISNLCINWIIFVYFCLNFFFTFQDQAPPEQQETHRLGVVIGACEELSKNFLRKRSEWGNLELRPFNKFWRKFSSTQCKSYFCPFYFYHIYFHVNNLPNLREKLNALLKQWIWSFCRNLCRNQNNNIFVLFASPILTSHCLKAQN